MDIIRVSIVEDNKHLRDAWEAMLEHLDEFQTIGIHEQAEDLLETKHLLSSDVLLLDIALPGISGIEAIPLIKEINPNIIIVMCSVYEDDEHIFEAIKSGAVGYLLKKTEPSELILALKDSYNGGSPMTPSIARKVIEAFRTQMKPLQKENELFLSKKEKEILNLLADGHSYKVIADDINLSIDGVRYHIRKIYEKLQVNSRSEAIMVGIREKIIK
jgi:DNA-binding NarL/FixJ family response regulator